SGLNSSLQRRVPRPIICINFTLERTALKNTKLTTSGTSMPVSTTEPLGQRLFKARLNILSLLNAKDDATEELKAVQQDMRQ
ncbi:hypothetical protein IAF30_21215, partial [Acinetobacter baumannii]|nr:hypothetical protein [Acinetobacter baumannii]